MNSKLSTIASSDERLWRAVNAGDSAAFQDVVERYQGAVAAVAFNVVGEFSASQDVAQETFWAAWKSRGQLREPSRLGAWLCGIARNLASEWRRKNKRLSAGVEAGQIGEPFSSESDPVAQSISHEEESIVRNSLEELPENYREVLVLFYRQSQSVTEVAAALELSEDAVKQRLSRGRTLLRDQIASLVEDVLIRSRPGKSFTTKVMAGIIGLAAAMKVGGTVAASSVTGKVIGGAAGGVASAATKAALTSGAAAGVAGGVVGAAGGLAGAWLGTWLPAQLAPTMSERRLLEENGKKMLRVSIAYTLLVLALTALLLVPQGWIYYVCALALATVLFMAYVMIGTVRVQRRVTELRRTAKSEDDPNPSAVKAQMETWGISGQRGWKGRSFTSSASFLSLPLIDVQISDPFNEDFSQPRKPKTARGWIAIGDRANGILLGIGGIARGLIAFGGMAYGGIAMGGVSLGLISMGGLALGLLAIGGGAIGHTAVGGGALGWDAAGGCAIGWHSAAGGLGVANHAAMGGMAIARDFAVGGGAIAREANTDAARQAIDQETLKWMLDWYIAHQTLGLTVIIAVSILPALCLPFFYSRGGNSLAGPGE